MMEWQPIETADKFLGPYLLWNGDVFIGYFETGKEWPSSIVHFNKWTTGMETAGQYDCGFARIKQPTHWMPLPDPPKAEE